MSTPTTLAVLAPLAGVVIGACGSLAVQAMSIRAARSQSKTERWAARREELRKALIDFLQVTQEVEREVQRRFTKGNVSADAGTLGNRMWLMQKVVDIVAATPAARTATFNFAQRLSDGLWKEMPEDRDFHGYLSTQRDEFLKAARQDLEALVKD